MTSAAAAGPQVTLRPVAVAGVAAIAWIWGQGWPTATRARSRTPWPPSGLRRPWTTPRWNGIGRTWVAEGAGTVAGFLVVIDAEAEQLPVDRGWRDPGPFTTRPRPRPARSQSHPPVRAPGRRRLRPAPPIAGRSRSIGKEHRDRHRIDPAANRPAAIAGAPPLANPAGLGFAPLIAFDLARLLEDPLEPTWVILAGAAALGSYGLLGGAAVPGPGCRCRPWPGSAWAPPPRPPWWSPRSWGLSGGRRPPRPCRLGRRPPSCQSVVVRSLAQFCLALDTTPAMTIVTVTVT